MTARVTPTFLLKGLDPSALFLAYQSGAFFGPPKPKSEIKLVDNPIILAPNYGTSNLSPIFSIKDKNNSSVIIATTGHEDFEVFTTTGGQLTTGGVCKECLITFNDISVGYPVAYKEVTVLDGSNYRIIYTFWVEGRFCCFECALGYVIRMLSRPSNYRDTTLKDTERLLKLLYKLTYPSGSVLRPSQNPDLLKANGGSLTREEWQDRRHTYVRTDRVVTIPVKVEYVQQNFISAAPIIIDHNLGATMTVTSS